MVLEGDMNLPDSYNGSTVLHCGRAAPASHKGWMLLYPTPLPSRPHTAPSPSCPPMTHQTPPPPTSFGPQPFQDSHDGPQESQLRISGHPQYCTCRNTAPGALLGLGLQCCADGRNFLQALSQGQMPKPGSAWDTDAVQHRGAAPRSGSAGAFGI